MFVGLIDKEGTLVVFHEIIVPPSRKHACQQRSLHIAKRAAQDLVLCAADVERYDIVGLGGTISLRGFVGEFLLRLLQLLFSLLESILTGTDLLLSSFQLSFTLTEAVVFSVRTGIGISPGGLSLGHSFGRRKRKMNKNQKEERIEGWVYMSKPDVYRHRLPLGLSPLGLFFAPLRPGPTQRFVLFLVLNMLFSSPFAASPLAQLVERATVNREASSSILLWRASFFSFARNE